MSVYRHKRKLSIKFLCQALALSFLPSIAGLAVLYISVSSQQSEQLNSDIEKSYRHFEQIFRIAANVANKSTKFESKPCAMVVTELIREATRQLYIRSINLVSNNKVYCSSVLATEREFQQISSEIHDVSTLVPGNTLTPNSPVLYIRHKDVIIAIDGRLLTSFIQSSYSGITLQFIIDNRELHESGWIYPVSLQFSGSEKYSDKWDFTIRGQSENGSQWSMIRKSYLPVVLLFILATLIIFTLFVRRFFSGSLTVGDIRTAIARGEIVPYAQPIFNHDGEKIWGVEILARWKKSDGEIIPPDLFIPLAERSNAILELTRSLMQQTAQGLANVLPLVPQDFHVAFNISNQCCQTDELTAVCRDFAKITQNKIALTLELTERESYQESNALRSLISNLKENGIKLAIDDFGTAGSNLDYVREIDFDFIKIDRSYVTGIGSSISSVHIIDNILDLANRMNMEVIAEGIEGPAQAEYLYTKGVQHFQGYFYSAPLPLDILISKYLRPFL
ncbi:TPA: EAL domain-containing protein [Citrobacter gillenii]